ncbi:MAG: RNA chaperone ProQ [Gammaproteobacteria bacterium]|nr:RNA chaperone ProQ [Gammaproteobacteria bacterium]
MQTQEKTDLNKVIAYLAETFPNSFSLKGDAKPIKVGIFADIAERLTEDSPVSKTQVRHALRRYTNSWRYLEAVCKGGKRVDLDGNEVEELTEEHVQHAQVQLAESKAKFQEKKKAANAKEKKSYKKSGKSVSNPPKRKSNLNSSGAKGTKAKPSVQKELVASEDFTVGKSILVKLGADPVSAVILETSKDEVSVQLGSGMIMKVKKGNIFQA